MLENIPTPKIESELKAMGYVFLMEDRCRDCRAPVLWYRTPRNKNIPIDKGTMEAHWMTCRARVWPQQEGA